MLEIKPRAVSKQSTCSTTELPPSAPGTILSVCLFIHSVLKTPTSSSHFTDEGVKALSGGGSICTQGLCSDHDGSPVPQPSITNVEGPAAWVMGAGGVGSQCFVKVNLGVSCELTWGSGRKGSAASWRRGAE
jgi:hypothetical protein